jgi:hypothetical protein
LSYLVGIQAKVGILNEIQSLMTGFCFGMGNSHIRDVRSGGTVSVQSRQTTFAGQTVADLNQNFFGVTEQAETSQAGVINGACNVTINSATLNKARVGSCNATFHVLAAKPGSDAVSNSKPVRQIMCHSKTCPWLSDPGFPCR